ncbi:MAG: glutamine-hydrolyzing carbamoyl-phosphate synthase small subunit [Elusimicrobiota bacterium]
MISRALLALEDGTVLRGRSCGAAGEAAGEMVFNTSLTGYQEVLTDPSYKGQLVVMTNPMIGNYGITAGDNESRGTFLEAFIMRELCRRPSNWESIESVGELLRRRGVIAVDGVDTRLLTRRLREKGALRAILSTTEADPARLLRRVRKVPVMTGRDLTSLVTCSAPYEWTEPQSGGGAPPPDWPRPPRVVVMDFGVKYGILRCLAALGCAVTVVPAGASAGEIEALLPDGILLSNGPGDPAPVAGAIAVIRRLLPTRIPIFGICLGHQLLALALGGRTFKLKFGHHGANHPVKDLTTGKIEITTQNHGFCVDMESLPRTVQTTHVNLNDGTSEGLMHTRLPVFSVQHHPEAAAGPHDARHLFDRFGRLLRRNMIKPRRRRTQHA